MEISQSQIEPFNPDQDQENTLDMVYYISMAAVAVVVLVIFVCLICKCKNMVSKESNAGNRSFKSSSRTNYSSMKASSAADNFSLLTDKTQ